MNRFLKSLYVCLFFVVLTLPAHAQDTPDGVFRDYDHMREVLDQGMKQRNIVDVMRAFGASDEMTVEELNALETRVRMIFPEPFEDVHIMTSRVMQAGWKQELYVYQSGVNYIFAMVLFHETDAQLAALQFKFNTDPLFLLADF